MYNVELFLKNINSRAAPFKGEFRFNEPMSAHTTFRTGGPADLWIKPEGEGFPDYAALLLESARNEGIPVFILGGGANIVAADEGLRGIVLDTTGYSGAEDSPANDSVCFRAGTLADKAAAHAAARGLSGMEFLAGLPGAIGGGLWMNARCYEREMGDIVKEVTLLENGTIITHHPKKEAFSYKKSPYQNRECLILSAKFAVQENDTVVIKKEMDTYRKDREEKGHYRFPSAGSAFKNNRAFGKPTGKILDELGLKGTAFGDAQLAPWHGNLIINRGAARSSDILALVEFLEERARTLRGIRLEREILFVKNS